MICGKNTMPLLLPLLTLCVFVYNQEKSILDSFVSSLLDSPDLCHLPAMQYHEGVTASSYLAMHVNNGTTISMRTCSLVLHTKYRFLGANPDHQKFCEIF